MTAIRYLDVRKGMVIVTDGQLQYVVARTRTALQLKNLLTGAVVTRYVSPDEQVEEARVEERAMDYIYQDGDGYVFMDPESGEPITLAGAWAGDQCYYLKEGCTATLTLCDGLPIGLQLPAQVELTVTDTAPALAGRRKSALLETGLKVSVPPGVDVGEAVLVDTRTGEFLSRAER